MKLVQYPHVDKTDVSWNRFGKLYRMTKLIVGVFGTSSKQGKYTLQLMLRKRFVQMGYNIGQIGTEPSALLFGMDYVFPMGYNSTVSIHEYDTITYLNNAIHNMEIAGKDIIIVGSQSGTVTYDYGNLQQFAVNQYSYLLGTLPELI
ncbi:MAG: DUF1611 domain-containing protein, partial [Lachnospiraceae bacterium]|nr:DUF1611 domain-containing protein [Lachnospiraceae bacterium]